MHLSLQLLATVGAPLGLLVVDFVLGVAIAVKQGGFSVQKLPGVAENSIVPLLVGIGGSFVQMAVQAVLGGGLGTTTSAAVIGLLALLSARTVADIKNKAVDLFGSAPSSTGLQLSTPPQPAPPNAP